MARAKTTKTKISEPSASQVRTDTVKNMQSLLDSYNKRFKNTYSAQLASDLIEEGDIDPLSSGHISFDLMTGIGGLPKGKIIEFTGEEGSHKSNAAWECVGNIHLSNDYDFCVWIDAEKAVDLRIKMQRKHVSNMHVDFSRLILVVPETAEECWSIVIDACQKGAALIVLDSVTALIPKKELKAGVEADGYPALPAAINRGFRSISKELWLSGSTLIEINQVRENLDITLNKKYIAFEDQWKTTGGKGLKHWLTLRLFFRKKAIKVLPEGADSKTPKVHIGDEVTVSIIKTRLAPKMDKAKLFMYHKSGFDRIEELLNMLIEWEIIYKETPRAQKYTFVDPEDENNTDAMSWDDWYSTLEEDKEYYDYMCGILASSYNAYFSEDGDIASDLAEQEAEDDEDYEDEEDE